MSFTVSDLSLSDEQRMLADAVSRFVEDQYDHPDWRRITDAEPGFCERRWAQMAELGWLGLAIPEDDGGYGGSIGDLLQVVEGLGRGLATEPLVSTALIGADLLAQCDGRVRAFLPRIVAGELRLALADEEPARLAPAERLATRARYESGRWRIEGLKCLVPDAPHAHQLIVSARIDESGDHPRDTGLFLVPVDHPGVRVDPLRSFDRRRLGQVTLHQVELDDELRLVSPTAGGQGLIERAQARLLAAQAAESLGIAQRILDLTRGYLATREQFGARLSSFQVLQHRLVDMFIALEELRTVARMATIACQVPDERMRGAVRVKLIQLLPAIGRQAIQLHGGMGMSDEYPVGDCMKRLEAIVLACGPIEQALDHFRWAPLQPAVADVLP